jgi:hypothetical protein
LERVAGRRDEAVFGVEPLGLLIEYRRGLCPRGVEIRLANLQAQVWLALESAGLWQLFERIDLGRGSKMGGFG